MGTTKIDEDKGMYVLPQGRLMRWSPIEQRNLDRLRKLKADLKKQERAAEKEARERELDKFYETHPLTIRVREILSAYCAE